ncbi:alpha-2-macroglobulin [bacterium]|nr:alpha-2-macroglobulin [bacterium]
MKTIKFIIIWAFLFTSVFAQAETLRETLYQQYSQGNYKDAFAGYQKLVLDASSDLTQFSNDLSYASSALANLGRDDELDALLEDAVKVRPNTWQVLSAVAYGFQHASHYGTIIAGKFYRGNYRQGGKYINSQERDRVRALQLVTAAIEQSKSESDVSKTIGLYRQLSELLIQNQTAGSAWKLEHLTDLTKLPGYEENYYAATVSSVGAPVTADGSPLIYAIPLNFETAKNDGERFRWTLNRWAELAPHDKDEVSYKLATFLQSIFGVETIQNYYFTPAASTQDGQTESQYALHTLSDDETIARLATGIKRFSLPQDYNPTILFKSLADTDESQTRSSYAESAREQLCRIYENRRQYPKAAECWKRAIGIFGKGSNNYRQKALDQIVGAWGQFEPTRTQAADAQTSLEYKFRNATSVTLEAYAIDIETLLNDLKEYIKSNPNDLDYSKVTVEQIGYELANERATKYRGKKVASWTEQLIPRENHFDTRITLKTPLQKAGAYYLVAKLAGGNESKIVMWLADTALINKALDQGTFYYVGDALNGSAISDAEIDFFGYRTEWIQNNSLVNKVTGRSYNILTRSHQAKTDSSGQLIIPSGTLDKNYSWLVTAKTKSGRFAYLGFSSIWNGNYHDYEYNELKVFTVTDRPVYRPEQNVKFKLWLAHAKYDQEKNSFIANTDVQVIINDPQGNEFFKQTLRTDNYGGLDGEIKLPKDAKLGVYTVYLPSYSSSSGTFRVEEYKKPEYEVTVDAPTKPIRIGDKIEASIKAKYYFGSPVTEAKVRYKVLRSSYTAGWYPVGIWDWFYGAGYWWFAYNYEWFPGWARWGCERPIPWWWTSRTTPPELLIENEVPIGKDGTLKISIDTELAKALQPDQDQRYQITAEVIDQSRRTIVGTGEVIATREPFKVYAWVDRGHYKTGDTINADFSAQTVSNKPVTGKGTLKLFKISYANSKVVETAINEWKIDPDVEGRARTQLTASTAGQYRLSYTVLDEVGHSVEGGYLFTVIGEGFNSKAFKFNALEIIPEKREYTHGEKAKVMINTEVADSTVLIFTRPANGIYLNPEIVKISGKSIVREIAITKKDMPNFFVEVVTIGNGRVYSEVKEMIVPPEERVLNVKVKTSQEKFKPQENAKVEFALTELSGRPFKGSAVVSVYDSSLEYISGGSNVDEIRSFFWKWRRHHSPRTLSSLDRYSSALRASDEVPMSPIGIFGYTVADDEVDGDRVSGIKKRKGGRGDSVEMLAEGGVGGLMASKSAAAPMVAQEGTAANAVADMREESKDAFKEERQQTPGGGAAGKLIEAAVRKEFADTAFWAGTVNTDENGRGQVEFKMPENLTEWKIKVWAIGEGTRVGQGEAEVVTAKDLILRLQTPRFLVERDEVVISANIHNYLAAEKIVKAKLELDGGYLEFINGEEQSVTVPSQGEKRIDWRLKAVKEGLATVRGFALTDVESDAMELKIPVHVHGILKTESFSGALRAEDNQGKISIKVPSQRRVDQSLLEIRYSPSLATAMVDALPYLVSYPYGCTEQTLNRFLPTVITQKILQSMKLDLKAIRDKRTNLNAQEIGSAQLRAAQWKRFADNPVFDEAKVAEMVKVGLDRLEAMQNSDGGWGWFSGYGEQSYPHTTAVVTHGLNIAKAAGVNFSPDTLSRALAWLENYQAQQLQKLKNAKFKTEPYQTYADELDAFTYMVLTEAGRPNAEMKELLFRDKTQIAVHTKAMLGIAFAKEGDKAKVEAILKNIEQYLVQDDENQTAYLRLPEDNYWWYWYGSTIEANSYYLKLLAQTNPKGQVASRLAKYLVNNRKNATYWNSTRDSATAIEALADYIQASGESAPNLTVSVAVDGKILKEVKISPENLFTFDNVLMLEGAALTDGKHEVSIKKSGTGPLYYNAYLTNFTLEDYITKAGLEIKVNRKFYKLVRNEEKMLLAGAQGQALEARKDSYQREPLQDLQMLKSGDLIEVELEIDSKNDYEYLIFEDLKAAGFEPVDLRSGYNGNELEAYVEFRDEKVSFFTRSLSRGKHSISYRLRAEIPGKFSALPTLGFAMYAPELKANADEIKLQIED